MSFFAVVSKIVKQHLFMHCFVSYRQHISVSRDSITFSVHNRMLLLALRWLFFRWKETLLIQFLFIFVVNTFPGKVRHLKNKNVIKLKGGETRNKFAGAEMI